MTEQCSWSYSLVKNTKKNGKCSSNFYNTEQIFLKIEFCFKEADYFIYIPSGGSNPLENLPPYMRRRNCTDEQNCCCQAGEIKCKGMGERNQFPLSLSSCTLCFCLSCLYRQIIVLSFLLWTVLLKHLWEGGCLWFVKGCDPDDKSAHLPEEVPAVLLWYRSAPYHMGSESPLYYLEDFLVPLEFSWGQSRLLKWLTYPWDLRLNLGTL